MSGVDAESPVPDFSLKDAKLNLVKAVRMLEGTGLLDMNGHISCRIPGTDRFLINTRMASRASLRVCDIVTCHLDGSAEDQTAGGPPSEVHIHTAIYRSRPDVACVVHNHPHWQTVLGIAGIPLKPVFSLGAFIDDVPVYEDSSLVNEPAMGDELARVLGDGQVVQLRHHGNVVVGANVKETFATTVFLEENAKKQYYAGLANPNIRVLQGANLRRTRETNWSPSIVQKVWNYYEEKSTIQGLFRGLEE